MIVISTTAVPYVHQLSEQNALRKPIDEGDVY